MSPFRRTYELQSPPDPGMHWEEYSVAVQHELRKLLDSGLCDEAEYQAFIEFHPSLLPWAYGTFGGGHHGLVHGAVISQPRLVGLAGKRPDFMYIARDTSSVYAVLIEIESPCKRWFTQSGQPDAQLTQAVNQLRQWKRWFEQPGSREKFLDEYEVSVHFGSRPRFQQRYILVYGRREELQASGFADQ